MKKVIGYLIAMLLLGAIAYAVWTLKVYIVSASIIIVVINLVIERMTGKKTWLTKKIEDNQ